MKNIVTAMCMFLASFSTQAQTITASVTTQPCNNNGVCSVTVTGLSTPISYTYSFGNGNTIVHNSVNSLNDQLINFANNGFGYIQCSASDGVNYVYNSCSYAVPFFVNVNVTPAICPSNMGSLSVTSFSGSPGPFSYSWTNTLNGAPYTGNTINVPVGSYSLEVTDLVTGCKVQKGDTSCTITQQSNINLTYSTTVANCTNGTASVTATGGMSPYSYNWSNGVNSQSISNLVSGAYSATVTDAQGCISNSNNNGAYVQQAISINVNTSITNATCLQNNGSAIAFATGGMPPYNYLWQNGQVGQNLTAVTGGTYYIVLATDANGCRGTGYASINATTPINVTYNTNASSCTSPTGSATLTISGGAAPYTTVWNTFPTTTSGITVSALPPGQYGFKVTDANGCVRTGVAVIPAISTINATINAPSVICPATTGNVFINASGTNGPFTYVWNNAATTSSLTNVALGYYSCVITDAVGCSVTKVASLYAHSPVSIGLSATPASCKYTADGSVIALATGGVAPYTYSWSNGQTTATASNLLTGYVWVTATSANGCTSSNNTYINYNLANTSCYCTISGKVYKDANSNCTIDGGETGIANSMIHCSGFGYTFTDANGNYSFQVPSGTYTLSETVNSSYPLSSCQSNAQIQTVTASAGCVSVVNFANNVIPLHDLHIITTSYPFSAPIPGNAYHQRVIIENNGTVSESTVQIGYTDDGQLGSLTASPALFTQQNSTTYPNWYSVQSGFPVLAAGASSYMNVDYNVPTNIPLGTTINFYDSTAYAAPINTNWLLDETPWNNVQNYQQTVIGSFDPNFKEVSPKGNGTQGYIATKDSVLSYIIHFQNEGSYFAQNISVVDSLDTDLDWTSLRPGYADHAYTTTVSENGIITFKFANVNLPWKSLYGDLMSSGMVSYTIKRKRNVAQETQFKNKAAIYFDYNEPVITNTTLNTLNDLSTSINENSKADNNELVLYPNPTNAVLNILVNANATNTNGQLTIIDITGKTMLSKTVALEAGTTVFQESTNDFSPGIYFVQLKYNNVLVTKKLVVIK